VLLVAFNAVFCCSYSFCFKCSYSRFTSSYVLRAVRPVRTILMLPHCPALSPVVVTFCLVWANKYYDDDKCNKTAELSQRRPRDAPNIWVP